MKKKYIRPFVKEQQYLEEKQRKRNQKETRKTI